MQKHTRKGESTRDRIVDVSLDLFNTGSYAKTSMASIAEAAGMSVGNLCYHFPSKRDLVIAQIDRLRDRLWGVVHDARKDGPVVELFVEIGYRTMRHMWDFRFVLRDRLQYGAGENGMPFLGSEPVASEHAAEVRRALGVMQEQGLMNSRSEDLDAAAISVWMVARYWWDYLSEMEQCTSLTWADQERGFAQILSVLSPHLNDEGRELLEAAFNRHVTDSAAEDRAAKSS